MAAMSRGPTWVLPSGVPRATKVVEHLEMRINPAIGQSVMVDHRIVAEQIASDSLDPRSGQAGQSARVVQWREQRRAWVSIECIEQVFGCHSWFAAGSIVPRLPQAAVALRYRVTVH